MKNEFPPVSSPIEGAKVPVNLDDMRKYMPKGYLDHYETDWASGIDFANVGTETESGKWTPLFATQALDIIAGNISAGNQQAFVQGVAQLSSYIKFGIIDGRCPENNSEIKQGLEKVNRAISKVKGEILASTIGSVLSDLINKIKENGTQTSYMLHLEQCRDLCK